ncbi:MAG: acyltransferase [Flavobacteriales bacterium]|nr:acyltransferase [Flavobacteriales bacterium]
MIQVDYSKRIYGLDVMRAIAILLVVRSHGGIFIDRLFDTLPYIPLPDGVELFFVLSGFLIGGILIRTIEREEGMGLGSLLHFWKRRWFRTLPNYYLILILNVLWVHWGWNDNKMEYFGWEFFLFVQNFSDSFYGFFWESWSLSIEEWFYLISPILIILLHRLLGLKKAILYSSLMLIVFSIAYRYWILEPPSDYFWWDVRFRKVVLSRLDAIMFGVLGAYLSAFHSRFWTRIKWPALILGVALYLADRIWGGGWSSLYGQVFALSLLSLSCALLLPWASSVKDFRIGWLGRSLTFISLISYSMYLVNLGLVAQVIKTHFLPETVSQEALWYAIYWVVVFLFSTVLYALWERPMMDLRDRWGKSGA